MALRAHYERRKAELRLDRHRAMPATGLMLALASSVVHAAPTFAAAGTAAADAVGLLTILGLVLLGGMVLNLMRGVLPVLSLRTYWRGHAWGKWVIGVAIATSLLSLIAIHRISAPADDAAKLWQMQGATAYHPRDLAQARNEERNVLVAITADRCTTCIANEQMVLGKAAFQDLLSSTETLYMKGDWTNGDPVVGEFLEKHHAPGVPLYVLYRGMDDQTTVLLPQVLTMGLVREVLEGEDLESEG